MENNAKSGFDIGLPEFDIADRKETNGDYLYILIPKDELVRPKACPVCGGTHINIQRKATQKVTDLYEYDHRVGLFIKGHRYICKDCGKTMGEEYPSIDGTMTVRLKDEIRRESFYKTFSELANRYSFTIPTISAIFAEEAAKKEADYVLTMPGVLGIDEVHLEKNYYGVYVSVSKDEGHIIEMTRTRSKKVVADTIRKMKDPQNLKYVTMDMWEPYKDAVREVFPDIEIIIDRFHVMKTILLELDEIRKRITKKAKDKKERKSLKNNRFLILTSSDNLAKWQRNALSELLNNYPELEKPYMLKESFRNIYDLANSLEEAEEMYEEWISDCCNENGEIIYFENFINTVGNWHDEIFSYFKHKDEHDKTNAQTESFNNRIKEVAGQGRGYTFDVLRAKMIFGGSKPVVQKYDFDAFNLDD